MFRTAELSIPPEGVKVADGDDAQSILIVNPNPTRVKAFGAEQQDADNIAFGDPGLTIDADGGAQEFVLPASRDELWLSSETGTVIVEVGLAQ